MIESARLVVFVDGVYLKTLQSVSLAKESGRTPIESLEGLLGISEGSKSVTLELTLAVPIGGEEFPFDDRWDTGAITSVQVGQGTKAFIANGKIMDVRTEQSTGEPAKQTVTWRGEPKANQ